MNARVRMLSLSVLALPSWACYTAELDTKVSEVFVCERTSDCPLGQSCGAEGVCRDELEGPALTITYPEPLHRFSNGESVFAFGIEGRNMGLTGEVSSSNPDAGYIEVYVDNELVDAITEGDLERGIDVESLALPKDPGLHHLVLSARNTEGDRFDNPESEAHYAFWVDDGREHIGILEPAPGTRFRQNTRKIQITTVALNLDFVNPGFLSADEFGDPSQAYVNLLTDEDLPTCLPGCNARYVVSLRPTGVERTKLLRTEPDVDLSGRIGIMRLQVLALTPDERFYYRDPEGSTELLWDEVPVQIVLGGGGGE